MKTNKIFMLGILALGLAGCAMEGRERAAMKVRQEGDAVRVSTTITSVDSRLAYEEGTGNTTFTAGDQIRVKNTLGASGNEALYTLNGSSWETTDSFVWNDSTDNQFEAWYTGYVSKAQIPLILKIMEETAHPGALRIVDPVMADNGRLYTGFDADFPAEMAKLCRGAHVIMPNLTEAAFLLNESYRGNNLEHQDYDEAYIVGLLERLMGLGAKNVVLTGVSYEPGQLGCACFDGTKIDYYFRQRLDAQMHGTGDVFASSFAGALCRGRSIPACAALGADFVVESMKATLDDKSHWYGVKFEKTLPWLIRRLEA